MSKVKTKTGENTITFDAFYQYIWARNYGDTDVYISNHNNIVAGDDDVALLPAGEAVRLTVNGKTLYVLGSTTLEVHAQNYSDSPFAWNEAGEGGGSDVSVVSLSVNENGTYTAPSGTAYSPVTVDTGIYTGTAEPSASLGKNGDYYYLRTDAYGALVLKDDTTYRSSMHTWVGFDFEISVPIKITKIKTRLSASTSIIYRIASSSEIIYESDTIEGAAGENEITLSTPVQLTTSGEYTVYVILGTNNGYYYTASNVIGNGKGITFKNGRCGENSSGTRPVNIDNTDNYAVEFDYKTDDEYIKSEYRKKSGSWTQI